MEEDRAEGARPGVTIGTTRTAKRKSGEVNDGGPQGRRMVCIVSLSGAARRDDFSALRALVLRPV